VFNKVKEELMQKVTQVKADQPNQQLRTSLLSIIDGGYKLF
jgi:hypothetical protein